MFFGLDRITCTLLRLFAGKPAFAIFLSKCVEFQLPSAPYVLYLAIRGKLLKIFFG